MRREDPQTDDPLLVDELSERLDRFRILYDRDDATTDDLLAELGGQGKVEREMLRELAATRVLGSPDRVPEAHAVAMRALEVLSRNGSRPAELAPPPGAAALAIALTIAGWLLIPFGLFLVFALF